VDRCEGNRSRPSATHITSLYGCASELQYVLLTVIIVRQNTDDMVADEFVFLFGGCTEDESKYFNDAFTLNTRTMTWACVRVQVR
jgi:hypothetical protein